MSSVHFKYDNSEALAMLRRTHNVLSKDFLKAVGLRALQWVNENFEKQGGLLPGGPWQPLKESTIARRRGGGVGARILQDTGRLRSSFDIYGVKERSNGVTIGTEVGYASYHEDGTEHLPIRKMLPPDVVVKDLAHRLFEAMMGDASGN
jgi:phage gpG-like protein